MGGLVASDSENPGGGNGKQPLVREQPFCTRGRCCKHDTKARMGKRYRRAKETKQGEKGNEKS